MLNYVPRKSSNVIIFSVDENFALTVVNVPLYQIRIGFIVNNLRF